MIKFGKEHENRCKECNCTDVNWYKDVEEFYCEECYDDNFMVCISCECTFSKDSISHGNNTGFCDNCNEV